MTYPSFSVGEVLRAQDMNAVGLWKVASGSLSLTTSYTNVAGVFSDDYKNYRVLLNVTTRSTNNRIDMRYIVGTTPVTAGYYQSGLGADFSANGVIYFQRSNNDGQFFGYTGTTVQTMGYDIFSPKRATVTTHAGNLMDRTSGYPFAFGGVNTGSDLITGFQLGTNTGTATVEYQVFGYKD